MKPLEELLNRYAELEVRVREMMSRLFSSSCGMCTSCCCRADICEEAVESAFLSKLLARQGLNAGAMDDRFGWLDVNGCSLEYGKPTVCYDFFCDDLLARLPDDETRFAVRVLGKLMLHVGTDAFKGIHLTELMDPDDLEQLDFKSIGARLTEAVAAYEVIEGFVENGRLSVADRELLDPITTEEL
jgi:hypothetical protein